MSTANAAMAGPKRGRSALALAVTVAALGYFVDSFDLVLFGVVRIPSLRDLGVDARQFAAVGEMVQHSQLVGLCVGGIFWGILGDKLGRRVGLFGALIVHSAANLLTAQVATVDEYAVLRFFAGVGLGGELGMGITLVSEQLQPKDRGWGTAAVAAMGVLGGLAAAQLGTQLPWRHTYLVAGGMGVLLLLLRLGVVESGLFASRKASGDMAGGLLRLLSSPARLWLYVKVIGVAVPIWYCVGVLTYFSRELGGAMGMTPRPEPGTALVYCYIGFGLGDLASGALSQLWKSRRRAIVLFIGLAMVAVAAYFTLARMSLSVFYTVCALMGFAAGYWAVFMTMVAEQFGTNMRGTATTTAPNFVRAAIVPMAVMVGLLQQNVGLGRPGGYAVVGAVCFAIALLSLWRLPETFGRELDFVER
ncbi:MAG: MFS transporter [Myxococcales bacterium]|nr:MFS transporter [Myxococcales bacterium]